MKTNNDLFVEKKSSSLSGKKITICGGGGIAAIELPKIARELRRLGADVKFFVSQNCLKFIGKTSLEWASSKAVVVEPSGFAEHICEDDAILIAPLTADLIAKVAGGICSDGMSTFIQSALGKNIPILVCSAMHESLANSPIVNSNKQKLSELKNIIFIKPRIEEGKEKLQSSQTIAFECSHFINNFYYKRGKIIVSYGGTRVLIDDVRCLTNLSTGKLGTEIIIEAYLQGISVLALEANVEQKITKYQNLEIMDVANFSDMYNILSTLNYKLYDGIFFMAAVSDYIPIIKETGKISSEHHNLSINLTKAIKLIDLEKLKNINFRFGAKLTSSEQKDGLEIAQEYLNKYKLNAILWNNTTAFGNINQNGIILEKNNELINCYELKNKKDIAKEIINIYLSNLVK